jgi:hypothetical protein
MQTVLLLDHGSSQRLVNMLILVWKSPSRTSKMPFSQVIVVRHED